MNKRADTPKPATTDQAIETVSSQAEIKADTIIKIIPTADLQFYIYTYAPTSWISVTSHSSLPPLSLWTFHLLVEGSSVFYHIRSYPDSHLYMTYVREDKVLLGAYSGNDDQKWILSPEVVDGREIVYICNIVRGGSYLTVRLPLSNGAGILTRSKWNDSVQHFILRSMGETP
ncbi:hypothetical protein [Pseudomonas thivervalensis]|uniref:hypothetical protein n=1 Tax=Pseudomonas thivervalensis TaxID=86265 RepID=UPI003D6A58AA